MKLYSDDYHGVWQSISGFGRIGAFGSYERTK